MMPNIVSVLNAEITRLARKEIRKQTEGLKKVISSQRAEISGLKQRLQEVEKSVRQSNRTVNRSTPAPTAKSPDVVAGDGETSHRFTAKGLAANRARLELSAADFGLLLGVSGASIYLWESGKTRPRPAALAAIAALRQVGKRDIQARLAELKG